MGANICDKHELSNCAECSGVLAAYQDTLKEPTYWQRQQEGNLPPLPHISGGPTIHARFAGNCRNCGRRYQAGDPIHYNEEAGGWIAVECCVEVPL